MKFGTHLVVVTSVVVVITLITASKGDDSKLFPLFTDHDHLNFPDRRNGDQVLACGPSQTGTDDLRPGPDGKFIQPLPGWGNYHFPISTQDDSAQFYFDQGLTMYYSYHQREAIASFREARRLDSTCAMNWWGLALSMGPNFNFAHLYKMREELPGILAGMNKLKTNATTREQQLIRVMNLRYPDHLTDSGRLNYNDAYATGLHSLIDAYPDDNDIRALYIDSRMLMHAWDFWNTNGEPRAWTPELVDLCKDLMLRSPRHPGAIHYYIHLTEASHHPGVALANAAMLRELFPGVAHMVHMSSHEYERNGQFPAGVLVNEQADSSLSQYFDLLPQLQMLRHVPHYRWVQSYCSLSGAMYQTGLRDALFCRDEAVATHDSPLDQYMYMMPAMLRVRVGRWDAILADTTSLAEDWTFASLLRHFSRGMALVHTGEQQLAQEELRYMRQDATDTILDKRVFPFNKPSGIASIAVDLLDAMIRYRWGNHAEAYRLMDQAIAIEDALIYKEPRDWMMPIRQYKAACPLADGKYKASEKVCREDLVWNPGNGWAMRGLWMALNKQGKNGELETLEQGYMISFAKAEQLPPSSAWLP